MTARKEITKFPSVKELKEWYSVTQTDFQLMPLLNQIMEFVVETSKANTPLMTKIVANLQDLGEEKPFVILWATANVAESPLLRIEQLKEENRRLEQKVHDLMRERMGDQAPGTLRKREGE